MSTRVLPMLVLALAGALPTAFPVLGQAVVGEVAPERAVPSWEHVSESLTRLDQALAQQFDGSLWGEVQDSVERGLSAIAAARDSGGEAGLCLAIQRTLQTAGDRQRLLEREAFATNEAETRFGDDDAAASAWLDTEYADVAAGLARLADELAFVEGRVPQTTFVLSEMLFNQARDADAAEALARGLAQWPRDPGLHDQVRAWSEVIPEPEHLVNQLEQRIDTLDLADADFAGIALETISMLHIAMGKSRYEDREFAVAALHFDRAARSLRRSRTMPRQWGADEIDYREADALVNAAYAYQGLALDRWAEDRADETAAQAAIACEKALTDALRSVPGHPAASDAVLWLGDRLMNKGDPSRSSPEDVADMRDFYGRMAERFDDADWWNNYAFWCRETGTAAEERGDADSRNEAFRLYETSYDAYRKTIALAPDNARYVNDTGLMLLYHLHRDLDEAKRLFERAWKLGADVCENPFVEDDVYSTNFEAYTDAMLNLARLHLERKQFEQAEQVVTRLLEIAPDRPDAQFTKREIDRAKGGPG